MGRKKPDQITNLAASLFFFLLFYKETQQGYLGQGIRDISANLA